MAAKKTREELIAEANAQQDAAGSGAGQPKGGNVTPPEDAAEEQDPPLSPEAKAEQDRILGLSEEEVLAEEGPDEDSHVVGDDPKFAAAEEALRKLRKIFQAYSPTAPNEHVCFGHGGERFTLGDFRALMSAMPPE